MSNPQQLLNIPQQLLNIPQQFLNIPLQFLNIPEKFLNIPQQFEPRNIHTIPCLPKRETPGKQLLQPPPPSRPKTNKRVAAGKSAARKTKEAQKKALADAEERAKKAEEKAARAAKKEPAAAPNPVRRPAEEEKPKSDSGGLSTTQLLTVGSIVVGLIGIYYKSEELKVAFKSRDKSLPGGSVPSLPTPRREMAGPETASPGRETAQGALPPFSPHGVPRRGCCQME